jgi:hypothetical protein
VKFENKEGEIVSVIQEVLSSIRVLEAFAREDYEERRLEEESLEGVDGIGLVLWFGAAVSELPTFTLAAVYCSWGKAPVGNPIRTATPNSTHNLF